MISWGYDLRKEIVLLYDCPAFSVEPVDSNRGGGYLYLWTFTAPVPELAGYDAEGSRRAIIALCACSVGVCYLNEITDFHAITSKCP
jgi:hypothetical protein